MLKFLKLISLKFRETMADIRGEIEIIPEELLSLFAKSLVPHIKAFYESKEGQEYFEDWLKKHDKNESVYSTNKKIQV